MNHLRVGPFETVSVAGGLFLAGMCSLIAAFFGSSGTLAIFGLFCTFTAAAALLVSYAVNQKETNR